MHFTHVIKLSKAVIHDLLDKSLISFKTSDLNFFFKKLDQSLSNKTLEKLFVVLRVADLGLKMVFGFLLHFLDHVKANLHLCHSALIDFSAFEDFFCNLD